MKSLLCTPAEVMTMCPVYTGWPYRIQHRKWRESYIVTLYLNLIPHLLGTFPLLSWCPSSSLISTEVGNSTGLGWPVLWHSPRDTRHERVLWRSANLTTYQNACLSTICRLSLEQNFLGQYPITQQRQQAFAFAHGKMSVHLVLTVLLEAAKL